MVKILNHPFIEIKLTEIRDKQANNFVFQKNLNEIATLMFFEILRDYQGKIKKVKTPTGSIAKGLTFNKEIVVVPILRAGLGMIQGIEFLIPQVKIGHIGMYRNKKTFQAIEYFYKMPKVNKKSEIIIVDPMLATGTSADNAIKKLKKDGFKNIKLVCLLGSPEGVEKIKNKHPNVNIYLAALDKCLDKNKFIIPGLGDAGDRLFGTK